MWGVKLFVQCYLALKGLLFGFQGNRSFLVFVVRSTLTLGYHWSPGNLVTYHPPHHGSSHPSSRSFPPCLW